MQVDVELDDAGSVVKITAVDAQKVVGEKLNQYGGKLLQRLQQQGVKGVVAQVGKVTLAATIILWIAWFFLPDITLDISNIAFGMRAVTMSLWDAIALDVDPGHVMTPGSHNFFGGLFVLLGIAAPIAVPFIKSKWSRLLYLAPWLVAMDIAFMTLNSEWAKLLVLAKQRWAVAVCPDAFWCAKFIQWKVQGPTITMEANWGMYVAVLATLVIAARVFKRTRGKNAGIVARPPIGGVVSSPSGFCTNCGKPLSAAGEFCTVCGARSTPATGS
jgi:hypothetical protein